MLEGISNKVLGALGLFASLCIPVGSTPAQSQRDVSANAARSVSELAGKYIERAPLKPATLTIEPDGRWELRWSRATAVASYGGAYFSGDDGRVDVNAGTITLRSNEYGDFDALASGRGTLFIDYPFLGDQQPRRFVKEGVTEEAPLPQRTAAHATAAAPRWTTVSAGAYHACALAADGRAYCWGMAASPAGSAGGNRPHEVPGGLRFAQLSVGSALQCDPDRPEQSCDNNRAYHVCGITSTGDAYCWGDNQYGQLGDGTRKSSATPVPVKGRRSWIAISAGEGATCGLTSAHDLFCWGLNDWGQLGIGAADTAAHPEPLPVAGKVRAVTVGSRVACAIADEGATYCWGSGSRDRLGTSEAVGYAPNPRPLRVESGNSYVGISAGRTHVCAATATGVVDCWGSNYYNESSPDMTGRNIAPSAVARIAFATVKAGVGSHSCAVTPTGAAYCWGFDGGGRLGAGGTGTSPCGYEGRDRCGTTPLPVTGSPPLAFSTVSAGLDFTCGVTKSAELYCWGDNLRGQLGTGDRKASAQPVRVAAP